MISYELAKELKDAGFPLDPNRNWDVSEWAWLPCDEITKNDREKLWIPSLEELIEVCEGHYPFTIQLDRYSGTYSGGKWICIGDDVYVDDMENGYDEGDSTCQNYWEKVKLQNAKCFSGKTPSEAVARLWLALNKNKDA